MKVLAYKIFADTAQFEQWQNSEECDALWGNEEQEFRQITQISPIATNFGEIIMKLV